MMGDYHIDQQGKVVRLVGKNMTPRAYFDDIAKRVDLDDAGERHGAVSTWGRGKDDNCRQCIYAGPESHSPMLHCQRKRPITIPIEACRFKLLHFVEVTDDE